MPHAPDIIETVIALATAGVSYKAIAERVKLTKSAVCGITFRAGIKSPLKSAVRKIDSQTASPRPRRIRTKTSKPLPKIPTLRALNSPGVTLDQLEPHHCRWILDSGRYCGEHKREGSYCLPHATLAYAPLAARQRRQAA